MNHTEDPDYEGWNPETDPPPPVPASNAHNQGILSKRNSCRSQEDKEPTERRIREWTQVFINLVLAVVGISAICYYSGQLTVMKGQLTEIIKQYPEIHNQAVATQGQLTQQQDAFKITERAWVSVTGTGFDYMKDARGASRARGTIVLVNTGPSPAFFSHVWTCVRVRASAPRIDLDDPRIPGCEETNIGMMGTNVPVQFSRIDPTKIVAQNSLPRDLDQAGDRLYVWGKITYFTFAKDGPHFTSFCLLSNGGQLGPCSGGNDAN